MQANKTLPLVAGHASRSFLSLVFLVCSAAAAEDSVQKFSPDRNFMAATRRIPDKKYVWKEGLDGCRVVILQDDEIYASHEFQRVEIEKMQWSPDSKFLVFTTSSSGGHSPWHFPAFVFCVADRSFRDLESGSGGAVTAPDFTFEDEDTVVVTVQNPGDDGGGSGKASRIRLSTKYEKLKAL